MLKINNKDITGVFIGSNSIHRIYLGQDVVWEKYTFPTNGLQHYWNLDETSGTIAYDSINNKNITFNYPNGLNNLGKNNTGAFGLNPIYGDSTPLPQNFSSPYNISFWFYVDPSSNLGVSRLINLGTPTSSNYYGISIYLNLNGFFLNFGNGLSANSNGRRSYSLNNAFVTGMWHHVSLNVVSLYDITLFINGVNTNISYDSGNATNVNYGNKIFSLFRNQIYTETDNVYIDEVGIWNKSLTLEEVQALYNYGNGSFYIKNIFNSLQHYWSFDETSGTLFYDSINNLNGSVSNQSALNSEGKNNSGISLISNVYRGEIPIENSNLLFKHTISLWFKSNTTSSTFCMLGVVNDGTNLLYQLNKESNLFKLQYRKASSVQLMVSIPSSIIDVYIDNNWHHLVCSLDCDSNYGYIYIDGNNANALIDIASLGSPSLPMPPIQYNMGVGERNVRGLFDQHFYGLMDELAIFDKILSPLEIEELYNNGNGKFYE